MDAGNPYLSVRGASDLISMRLAHETISAAVNCCPEMSLLLAHGGHGFHMLEPSEMIEVKQGPYAGDMDKTRFVPQDGPLARSNAHE